MSHSKSLFKCLVSVSLMMPLLWSSQSLAGWDGCFRDSHGNITHCLNDERRTFKARLPISSSTEASIVCDAGPRNSIRAMLFQIRPDTTVASIFDNYDGTNFGGSEPMSCVTVSGGYNCYGHWALSKAAAVVYFRKMSAFQGGHALFRRSPSYGGALVVLKCQGALNL